MNLLLDTCCLLWLTDAPERLPLVVRTALEEAAVAYVSAVSALELGIKVARGKLELPLPVSAWLPAVCQAHGLEPLAVGMAVAAASTELPRLHADPFDRILIATALQQDLHLLTPDENIQRYPHLKTLW